MALWSCGGKAGIDSAGAAGTVASEGGSVSASGGTSAGFGGAAAINGAGAPNASAGAFNAALSCVSANLCSLTPADIACNIDSDCTVLEAPGCAGESVIGVNRNANATCVAPPCLPPPPDDAGCGGVCPVYYAEDCHTSGYPQELGVHCVEHVCLSYQICPYCLK